jgi:hypothetical protein
MPVLAALPAEGISVFGGSPRVLGNDVQPLCRPVYSFSDAEPPAVPTGRVFVQLGKDESRESVSLAELVGRAGYEVESVPPYAPNAAWVVASDGKIASALANLERLIATPGIESVEPQMLRPAAYRGE